jgi:hypothetical protein
VTSTGSNVPDVKEVLHVVDEVPPVRGKVGHPRKRPEELYATAPTIRILTDRNSESEALTPRSPATAGLLTTG